MVFIPDSFNRFVKLINATVDPPGFDHPESILTIPIKDPFLIVLVFFMPLIQKLKTFLIEF